MVGGERTKAAGAPAEAEMDLDFSRWGAVPSFEFAFNSENFSDRVLQLEVVARGDDTGQPVPDSARRPEEEADKGQSIDSSSTIAGTAVLTVRTLHINSAILAARSPFFLKLFSNGMKESDQVHPRIRIDDYGNVIASFSHSSSYIYNSFLLWLCYYLYSFKVKT
uniref:Uncharacterized protein n=1 Tax=Avena sativa TaxID=4498 RepID=A0ACD6A857_AVESA